MKIKLFLLLSVFLVSGIRGMEKLKLRRSSTGGSADGLSPVLSPRDLDQSTSDALAVLLALKKASKKDCPVASGIFGELFRAVKGHRRGACSSEVTLPDLKAFALPKNCTDDVKVPLEAWVLLGYALRHPSVNGCDKAKQQVEGARSPIEDQLRSLSCFSDDWFKIEIPFNPKDSE